MEQIIGVDFSNKTDKSATSSFCSNCGRIIDTEIFDGVPQPKLYKNCPICGVVFDKHKIVEENDQDQNDNCDDLSCEYNAYGTCGNPNGIGACDNV